MIKRTVEISSEPAHVSACDGQLLINRRDATGSEDTLAGSIPLEDLGLLMIDQKDTTLSLSALAGAVESGAAVCVCGANHLPVGLCFRLPIAMKPFGEFTTRSRLVSRPGSDSGGR